VLLRVTGTDLSRLREAAIGHWFAGRRVRSRRQARLRRKHGREGHSGVRAGRGHAAGHRTAYRRQGRAGGDPLRRQV